jgi:hypothetical protein
MEQRNLDGVYFRVQRNGKWENVCFSDLTEDEMDYVLGGRDQKWCINLCKILGKKLRQIGDQFDIMSE